MFTKKWTESLSAVLPILLVLPLDLNYRRYLMCVRMSSSEYSKQLRHPKWQKMKTRVQIRADFKCEHPGCEYTLDENNHLNVHHTKYEYGKKPWECPIENLQCLCERHHKEVHGRIPKQPAVDLGDPNAREKIIDDAVFDVNLRWDYLPLAEETLFADQETPFSGGMKVMYGNGQKKMELINKDGKLWTAVTWKPNGEKCPDTNVVDGNGVVVGYNLDGTEEWRSTYKDGEYFVDPYNDLDDPTTRNKIIAEAIDDDEKPSSYTGWVKRTYLIGQISYLVQYKDGKPNGLLTSWYENGLMHGEGYYKNGKQDGLSIKWFVSNGQRQVEATYKDGKLMTIVSFKPNGEKCSVTNLKDGNGVVIEYNDDGTEKYRGTYKDGVKVED
jgi:antitoxin component YwqK of YwqJK toxin-antitoxin module